MLGKFSLFAALAFIATLSSCYSQEAADPVKFVKETISTLSALRAQCKVITDDVVTYMSSEMGNKVKVISELDECGAKLLEIETTANTFDLEKVDDVETKAVLKRLRNWEDNMKLGEDIIQVGLGLKAFKEVYDSEDTTYYDDSDVQVSISDIESGQYITRVEIVDEMNYYWEDVADTIGPAAYEHFFDFVTLVKKTAKKFNVSPAQFWYPGFTPKVMEMLESTMEQMKPFYEQMHAYARYKLVNRYGVGVIKRHGPIPETLFQQVVDRVWGSDSLFDVDFPLDAFPEFKKEFKAEEFVDIADKFFKSIGFDDLSVDFRKQHIFGIPEDDDTECVESFADRRDYNLTFQYCDGNDFEHFLKYHEYFARLHGAVLKKDLPWFFYSDNAMSNAVANAVKLAIRTPKYLIDLDIYPESIAEDALTENENFRLAIDTAFNLARKFVELRVAYDLFDGKIQKEEVNKHYWKLFEKYAGVEPPIDRTEDSLDLPYSFYVNVMNNKNLLREFGEELVSYDFYKEACRRIGHTGLLHKCSFYNEKSIGDSFKEILAPGTSKPYEEVIKLFVPSFTKLNADAFLAYYEPTMNWLVQYNKKHNLTTGWNHSTKKFSVEFMDTEEQASAFVEKSSEKIYTLYNQIVEDLYNKKQNDDEFEDDYYGNVFWKTSKSAEAALELKQISMKAQEFDISKFKSRPLKKAIQKLGEIADVFVLGDDLQSFTENKQRLFNTSTDVDIAKYKDVSDDPETVAYNPYILNVIRTTDDPKELKYYWEAWRDANGQFAKNLLSEVIQSFNKAAEILEISSTDFWFKHYGNDFVSKMEKIIEKVKPFYTNLHYYVRERLTKKFGKESFSMSEGSIPDHYISQVLAQIWTNSSIVEDDFDWHKLPPTEHSLDEKKYDALKLLKVADEFYQSLGFQPVEDTFWNDRLKAAENSAVDANCHATVYDMTPKVYMTYCDRVSYRKLLQAHGYMGRVHYAVEKKDLPAYYFNSYDLEYPVGEAVILSASAYKHSKKIGLITDFEVTDETLLNRMIRMAIHTMFNLHKYFVHTKLMAEYLEGEIEENDLTKYYWKYMIQYAGIEPPMDRTERDFDFPFEFYTDLEQNYQVKKFVSEVLGYHIYERLCKLSDHKGDLNNCDFSGSTEAGDALKKMMHLGSSSPYKTVLKTLVQDVSGINGNSLLNYYEPLIKWFAEKLEDPETNFDSFYKFLRVEYFV